MVRGHHPRVLLSAFACDPFQAGEPYVGWNWALIHAQTARLTLVTRAYHATQLRIALNNAGYSERVEVKDFDLPFCSRVSHRATMIKAYYALWQLCVFARYLLSSETFTVIHHVTYNTIEMPGFFWLRLRGARFILGPVGGGQVPPVQLRTLFGKRWVFQILRGFLKQASVKIGLTAFAIRAADKIFVIVI